MFGKHVYTWFGLKTIGGTDSDHPLCIQYVGKPVDGWKDYYDEAPTYGKPWKMWFTNPIFCNKSHYDTVLGKYRVWFCVLWHSVQW